MPILCVPLNVRTFSCHFAIRPQDAKTEQERRDALIFSVIVGIITCGFFQLIASILSLSYKATLNKEHKKNVRKLCQSAIKDEYVYKTGGDQVLQQEAMRGDLASLEAVEAVWGRLKKGGASGSNPKYMEYQKAHIRALEVCYEEKKKGSPEKQLDGIYHVIGHYLTSGNHVRVGELVDHLIAWGEPERLKDAWKCFDVHRLSSEPELLNHTARLLEHAVAQEHSLLLSDRTHNIWCLQEIGLYTENTEQAEKSVQEIYGSADPSQIHAGALHFLERYHQSSYAPLLERATQMAFAAASSSEDFSGQGLRYLLTLVKAYLHQGENALVKEEFEKVISLKDSEKLKVFVEELLATDQWSAEQLRFLLDYMLEKPKDLSLDLSPIIRLLVLRLAEEHFNQAQDEEIISFMDVIREKGYGSSVSNFLDFSSFTSGEASPQEQLRAYHLLIQLINKDPLLNAYFRKFSLRTYYYQSLRLSFESNLQVNLDPLIEEESFELIGEIARKLFENIPKPRSGFELSFPESLRRLGEQMRDCAIVMLEQAFYKKGTLESDIEQVTVECLVEFCIAADSSYVLERFIQWACQRQNPKALHRLGKAILANGQQFPQKKLGYRPLKIAFEITEDQDVREKIREDLRSYFAYWYNACALHENSDELKNLASKILELDDPKLWVKLHLSIFHTHKSEDAFFQFRCLLLQAAAEKKIAVAQSILEEFRRTRQLPKNSALARLALDAKDSQELEKIEALRTRLSN